jgi:hypothetical protein
MPHPEANANTHNLRPMTMDEKIEEIFTYHPADADQQRSYIAIRDAAKYLAKVIVTNTIGGSDQTAAIRKLREAVMTANAAVALRGLNF